MLERLLDAADLLLEQRPIDAITVRDLVERAGASTGSFYARFVDKDACLQAAFERLLRAGTVGRDTGVGQRTPMRGAFVQLMRAAVRTQRAHRGLVRALITYVRAHPGSSTARMANDADRRSLARFAEAALAAEGLPGDGKAERHAGFALTIVFGALRDGLVFASKDAWPELSDRELADELSRMVTTHIRQHSPRVLPSMAGRNMR